MTQPSEIPGLVSQLLDWGDIRQQRMAPADTMFVNTGRRLYVLGDIDGGFRPRSNPYDLYAFGHPQPDDPLADRLQGVWAQPVKGLSAYGYALEVDGERLPFPAAGQFTQTYVSAGFAYEIGPLRATRRDSATQDLPALFSTITLTNADPDPLDVRLFCTVIFDLQDIWFTQLADHRNQGQQISIAQNCLLARAESAPRQWAVAVGGASLPDEVCLFEDSSGEFVYDLHLEPGEEVEFSFGVWIESQGGASAALQGLAQALEARDEILAQKQALYDGIAANGPRLNTPDALLNAAFAVARANLQMLEAEQPALGHYFYAGLENFPYWFSNDGAYSAVGLLAAGLGEALQNHVRIGLRYLGDGQVPHQIAASGEVAFAGNAPETPLWVLSIWDTYRWSGDRDFLAEMFAGACQGMFEHVLGTIDQDEDGYPSGAGMVEVAGMGPEKLDSAVYTWAALHAVANMAEVLEEGETARQARAYADDIATRFDSDWWDESGKTYAMSLLDEDNARYPLPHWAVIVPLEVGLATSEHAARTFQAIRAHYLNAWGMKHTVGSDERIWTLPTATLSRAAFRYGEPDFGLEMLRHVAETLQYGSIGLFHELIPAGACILQLWSAATYLRGVIEDLFGIEVHAAQHALQVDPHLPTGWQRASLDELAFGEHRVRVEVSPAEVVVTHLSGAAPLVVYASGREVRLVKGETARFGLP